MTYEDPYGGRRYGRSLGGLVISQAELQRLEQLVEALNTRLEQALAKNQTLQATLEQQAKELHQAQQALTIRDEALHKQAEHQQQLEAELLFVRAALAEEQKKLDSSAEIALWQQRYLSLQADVDNLRRRWEQRAQTESAEHRRQILADMLPLADHLDLALLHQPAGTDDLLRSFIGNLEATRRAFLETLRRYGVERIDPLHQPFDPTLHEALGQAFSASVTADHVLVVVQAGYGEGERLLRPARVLVSSGPEPQVHGE